MYIAKIEAEVGRVDFDIPESVASLMTPKEYVRSLCFEELSVSYSAAHSYRQATKQLNRALRREADKEVKVSTLNEHVESMGRKAVACLQAAARDTLETHLEGYTGDLTDEDIQSQLAELYPEAPSCACAPVDDPFKEQIEQYNSGKDERDQIKRKDLVEATESSPESTVYISVDDVGVQRQKDKRTDNYIKDKKRVENTVIHVEADGRKYVITAIGMHNAFTLLMAFLISNELLGSHRIVFFSDGAQNIRSCIEAFFSFRMPVVHMLDWYHLEKRMKELLSMAVKGNKEAKTTMRNVIGRMLWAGNVDEAIAYLEAIPEKSIKNQQRLGEAVDYLKRRKPHIPCYALRSLLGYRNSSNPAEKANDRVVAVRQKHNGMSWSSVGSSSLALITALELNNELGTWISTGTIPFNINSATYSEGMAA
jgi:hypothetical protein